MKAMEEHDEAPSFRASTNIYLTFKTIQLLNQLRRKFRTRVRSTRLQTKVDLLGNDLRQDIAVETINGVEKLLSSDLSELESKQRRGESNRIFKSRKDDRQLIHRRLKGLLFKNDNRKDKGLNCAFSQLASLLGCSTHSLAQIASDDKLFLQSMGINRFTSFTRTHIASYLPLVESALHCIWRSASGARGARRLLHLENGLTQTYLMDEKFIANLEHMLFRLRGQLVQSLFDKLLEAVRNDYESWHDYFRNQRKLGENWFAEYADNKRPLSTTWPWSIKPSLAVIWGVCWKFYYPPTDYGGFNPPQHSSEENPAVSQRYFLADGNINWGRPEQNQYLNYELQNLGLENSNYGQEIQGQGQQQLQQPSPVLSQVVDLWAAAGQQQQHTQHSDRYPTFIPSDLDRHSGHFYGKEELYHVKVSNAGHGSLSPLVSSPSQADVSKMVRASNFRLLAPQLIRQPTQRSQSLSIGIGTQQIVCQTAQLPQQAAIPAFQEFDDYNSTDASCASLISRDLNASSAFSPWPEANTDACESDTSPGRSPSLELPQRRQASLTINSPIRVNVVPPVPDAAPLAHHPHRCPDSYTYDASQIGDISNQSLNIRGYHLTTQYPNDMHMQSNQLPPSPVSSDGYSRSKSPPSRKMLEGAQDPEQDSSEDAASPEGQGNDMFSPPRRGHSYKRTESPERNEENKMICTRSAKCSHLTFDRKCEWNKHMDKHDRPYKCKHQGCEKIQGFTYSGGLLRHQREVHKLYGGTRQSLFCPYNECKRSSGQGFTRKENLHEHIRRVHRKASGFSDEVKVEGEVAGALVASPTQADEELSESERPGQKRQRLTGADPADLRAEIKRLRRQNQEKDQRLLNLENAVMRLQQGDRG